jgi:hypothetical protein
VRLARADGLIPFTKGKDTMRRLLVLLTALVLLGGAAGCDCVCGVCDCDHYVPCAGGCCTGDTWGAAPVVIQEKAKTPAKAPDKE